MDSSTSATQRAFAVTDILTKILSYLDNPSLFATLLTSKTFFEASTPILYQTITIKAIRGPQNPLYRYPHHLKKKIIANRWTKNNLVNLIKRVDLYVHRQSQCPYTVNNTRYNNNPLYKNPLPLPNLKILHLVGGHQQSVDKEEDRYCDQSTCPFVLKQCMFTEKVIIRQLDFRPLKRMDDLQQVILKIRPCQLPRSIDNPFDTTLISSLPSSVRHLKIVWWDESIHLKWIGWKINLLNIWITDVVRPNME
ncbi:uncharacterized protein L199_008609 [Kwoniella botswanensis]|uniref:uncharacterized protein n=1 Tax=Kwoniella botswanensis TaxID=1268659 RepID=UPI00315D1D84